MKQKIIALLFVWTPVFISGCSGGGGTQVPTVSVSGVIKMNGTPLEGATVNFFSKKDNFLSTGVTDAQGKYQLYRGAVVGENKVWISKILSSDKKIPEGADIAEFPDLDPAQSQAADSSALLKPPKETGEQIPKKFSDVNNTVLSFPVPESGTDAANFDITKE